MSVVVAAMDAGRDPGPCLGALSAELADGDEVVWVGPGPAPPAADVAVAAPGPNRSRGALYRAGLDAAAHPLVAFTDVSTVVQAGWRRAAGERLASGAAAVGGPVLPAGTARARDFTGFVVEYGPHAVPPYASASGDVAANNVAYARSALARVLHDGEELWKSIVDGRLAAAGSRPVIDDRMRVVSTKTYRWSDLVVTRGRHGRLYGAQVAARMGRRERRLRAVACTVVPVLAYRRLAARLGRRSAFRSEFLRASPLVLVALAAWSAGEATGLWTGRSSAHDVF